MLVAPPRGTPDPRILDLANRHSGETILVLGSGPSLLRCPPPIKDYTTIAVNWGWALWTVGGPDYLLWSDHQKLLGGRTSRPRGLVWAPELIRYSTWLVYGPQLRRGKAAGWEAAIPWDGPDAWRRRRATRGRYEGFALAGSMAHSAVHAAFYLGAEDVIVCGCDCQDGHQGRSYWWSEPGHRVTTVRQFATYQDGWQGTRDLWPGTVWDGSPADVRGLGAGYPKLAP